MDRAAAFRLRRGDLELRVNCAEDEPMRACVDAAGTLLDRFSAAAAPR